MRIFIRKQSFEVFSFEGAWRLHFIFKWLEEICICTYKDMDIEIMVNKWDKNVSNWKSE